MSKKYTTNFLEDTNGSTGSANQVLISTPSGIDWVDGSGSGIIGGPYLPLSAGASYPLTGDLLTSGNIYLNNNKTIFGKNTSGSSYGLLTITSGNVIKLGAYAYTSAATQIGLGDNGSFLIGSSTVMKIDSSGNVGIGTTSPNNFGFLEKVLNISAGSSSSTTLQQAGIVISGSSDADDADDFGYLSFTNYQSAITNDRVAEIRALKNGTNVDTGEFAFYTSSGSGPAERMRIDSSGNVGIGTSSPDAKLDVNGNIRIPNAGKIVFGTAGSPNDYLELNDVFSSGKLLKLVQDGATRFDISGVNGNVYMQGNVGIGTTSPTLAKLEVRDSSTQTGLLITSDGGNEQFKIQRYSNNNEQLILGFHSSDYAQIQAVEQGVAYRTLALNPNGGNVGIGTTDPSSLLHIKGADPILTIQDTSTSTSNASSTLRLGESGVGGVLDVYWDIKQASDNLNTHLEINHSSNGNHFTILDNGNVGIGTTSPSRLLDVDGIQGWSLNNVEVAYMNPTATGTDFALKTSGINVIRLDGRPNANSFINNGGNVGIGTTSPLGKLQVNEYTVASQGNQNVHGELSVFANSGDESLFLGVRNAAYPNRGWAFNPVVSGVNSDLQIKEHGSTGVRMTLKSGGNVGIGTTSPEAKLDVEAGGTGDAQGDTTTAAIFRAGRQNVWFQNRRFGAGTDWNNNTFKIIAKIDNTSHQSINFVNDASYQEHIDIYTGNQVFNTRFNANGNVGIGTASPQQRLQVASPSATSVVLGASYLSTNNNNFFEVGISANDGYLNLRNSGVVTTVHIDSDNSSYFNGGNVGIGTTNPLRLLSVFGAGIVSSEFKGSNADGHLIDISNSNASPTYNGIRFQHNTTFKMGVTHIADGTTKGYIQIGNGYAAGSEILVVDGRTSNVGIGTTSPAVQLELGDNTADEKLRLTGAASGKPLMTFYNTTTKIGQIASSSVGVTVTSLGSGNMSFENGGNNRLVIDNSGNVGIADTSPSYKLDVDGTIRATGDVIAYSDIRVKENIKTIDNAVSKVNKLRGVEFNKIGSEEKSIGVIAQEIEKVLPEVVKEDDKGMKSVAYGNIVGVLIEAIKDQQKQIDELKSIINGSTK